MGWNLPPGCSINDLPGNSPEDCRKEEAWEYFCEKVYDGPDETAEEEFEVWYSRECQVDDEPPPYGDD